MWVSSEYYWIIFLLPAKRFSVSCSDSNICEFIKIGNAKSFININTWNYKTIIDSSEWTLPEQASDQFINVVFLKYENIEPLNSWMILQTPSSLPASPLSPCGGWCLQLSQPAFLNRCWRCSLPLPSQQRGEGGGGGETHTLSLCAHPSFVICVVCGACWRG